MGCFDKVVAIYLLAFLFYLLLAVILVPIICQCQSNSIIPQNAAISLTMQDWIYGGLGGGLAFIVLFALIIRCLMKDQGDAFCQELAFGVLLGLQVAFMFIWSIIGLVLYKNYYGEACQNETYTIFMQLGIYFGLVYSSPLVILFIFGIIQICINCVKQRNQSKLLAEPDQQARSAPDNKVYKDKKYTQNQLRKRFPIFDQSK